MIDIFNIQPHVVSRSLRGKSFLFYGRKKSGKTTTACKFPDPLLIAAEKGYSMINGIRPLPVSDWTTMVQAKNQLLRQARDVENGKLEKTTYQTVIVDTADLAYNYCVKHICNKYEVDTLDDTPNKCGYKESETEFDTYLQEIVKAGYTLICISHDQTNEVKTDSGEKYHFTQPTMDKRASKVISRMVDVIGYITFEEDESGHQQTMMYMRGSKYLEAGSRNPYTSEKIVLSYENLRDDMAHAVDMMVANGDKVEDAPDILFQDTAPAPNFDETFKKIKHYAKAFKDANITDEYTSVVEQYLGKGRLVRDCGKDQIGQLVLILDGLQEKAIENGIAA